MTEYYVFQGKNYHEYGCEPGTYQDEPLEPEGWYYILADDPVGPFPTEAYAISDAENSINDEMAYRGNIWPTYDEWKDGG